MIIYIDIDNTICTTLDKSDYTKSTPIIENIEKANALYDKGHTIIYWTARGTQSGKDWSQVTREQFKNWAVKYHDLIFGKPHYDVFIDDKNINVLDFDNFFKQVI
jgi:hypothetical protein